MVQLLASERLCVLCCCALRLSLHCYCPDKAFSKGSNKIRSCLATTKVSVSAANHKSVCVHCLCARWLPLHCYFLDKTLSKGSSRNKKLSCNNQNECQCSQSQVHGSVCIALVHAGCLCIPGCWRELSQRELQDKEAVLWQNNSAKTDCA